MKQSSLCTSGPWDIGSALLEVCNVIMRVHQTETVFKGYAPRATWVPTDAHTMYMVVVGFHSAALLCVPSIFG